MKFKNTYLSVLYEGNRTWFYLIVAFLILTFFTTVTKFQMTPFTRWDVYSAPIEKSSIYDFYSIEYNDGKRYNYPQPWNHHKKMMVYYTLNWYGIIKDNDFMDPERLRTELILDKLGMAHGNWLDKLYVNPEQMQDYPIWFKDYLSRNLNVKVDSVAVYKIQADFNENGQLLVKNKSLIFKL